METASSTGDHNGLKSDLSSSRDLNSSRDDFFQHGPTQRQHPFRTNADTKRGESFPLKATRSSNTGTRDLLLQDDYGKGYSSAEDSDDRKYNHHNAKDNQGYSSDPPSPPPLLPPFAGHYQDLNRDSKPPEYYASAGDHLNRPSSVNTQPGQLIFCHSMEQMKESMYHSMVPTLVIPAHYMHLSSDLTAVEQAMERQQQLQHDMEGIQVSMTLPRQQSQKQQQQQSRADNEEEESGKQADGSSEENWGSDQSSAPVRIPVLFNDSTIAQMNGELQAMTEKKLLELGVKPHPRAWFVSLDGRSNSLVRHSYIELSNEALRPPMGACNQTLDQRTEAIPMNSGKPHRKVKEDGKVKEGGERKAHGKIYSKLPVIETPDTSSESHSAMYSPEENSTAPLLDETAEASRGGTFPRKGRSRDNSTRSSASEVHRDSVTSPDDDNDDKDDDGENKKSPWQKREERPLMVFNVK